MTSPRAVCLASSPSIARELRAPDSAGTFVPRQKYPKTRLNLRFKNPLAGAARSAAPYAGDLRSGFQTLLGEATEFQVLRASDLVVWHL